MFTVPSKQVGEWFEVGAEFTDPVTKRPVDITGATITLTVRTGLASTSPAATVTGQVATVLDGTGGKASAGGRISTAGTYYGTLTADKTGEAGWPVKEVFTLRYEDCP